MAIGSKYSNKVLKASVFCMPVLRRTSASLVICAEAVHSVNPGESSPLLINSSLAGIPLLSTGFTSEGPACTTDLVTTDVAASF